MIESSKSLFIRNQAIDLYIHLGLPKVMNFLCSLLNSSIHRKWFVLFVLFAFLISKRSTMGKYFLLENRVWTEKLYHAKDLAPFYPSTGDLPKSVLQNSLETVANYVRSQLGNSRGRSVSIVRYWLTQKNIPPAIVIEPPLQRPPFSEATGYLLDGNHRAIAMVLKGESVRAYVGILVPDVHSQKV